MGKVGFLFAGQTQWNSSVWWTGFSNSHVHTWELTSFTLIHQIYSETPESRQTSLNTEQVLAGKRGCDSSIKVDPVFLLSFKKFNFTLLVIDWVFQSFLQYSFKWEQFSYWESDLAYWWMHTNWPQSMMLTYIWQLYSNISCSAENIINLHWCPTSPASPYHQNLYKLQHYLVD